MSNDVRVPVAELEGFATRCLVTAGATPDRARTTAEVLTRTEALGIHSHGLKTLGGYLEKARRGALELAAEPVALVDLPAFALLDGRNGIGMVSGVTAVRTAIEKASAAEVLHPGQLEWRHHDRAVADGVPLPPDVRTSLEALRAAVGVPVPWLSEPAA